MLKPRAPHAVARRGEQTMSATQTTLFVCGDVMTGRGIDQILRHPGDPTLYERHAKSAKLYVEIAERENGPIPRAVSPEYIWGDALAELDRIAPAARVVNLETAVTTCDTPWPAKGINYRMHPANLPCLTAARIDCCVLANNHVLDWGREGLAQTLETLRGAGIRTAGAGVDEAEAGAPAIVVLPGGARLLVFACATEDSGVPFEWAARGARPGVRLLEEASARSADAIAKHAGALARPGDLVVVSVHWGSNWGYQVAREQRAFARRLIDSGVVHAVHGHSSHHPRPIEVYRGRPILYGCGDLINDYEGIGGSEAYRPELALMYFPAFDPAQGRLTSLSMEPVRMRRFRLERATMAEAQWLAQTLSRESSAFGTRIDCDASGELRVSWRGDA